MSHSPLSVIEHSIWPGEFYAAAVSIAGAVLLGHYAHVNDVALVFIAGLTFFAGSWLNYGAVKRLNKHSGELYERVEQSATHWNKPTIAALPVRRPTN